MTKDTDDKLTIAVIRAEEEARTEGDEGRVIVQAKFFLALVREIEDLRRAVVPNLLATAHLAGSGPDAHPTMEQLHADFLRTISAMNQRGVSVKAELRFKPGKPWQT